MHKLYYSISEVSRLVDEEQHILRYWEKEFSQLKPKKNRGGNRIYSEKDIALIKAIKYLLRNEKLSLKGAQEQINKLFENPSDDRFAMLLEAEEKKQSDSGTISVNINKGDVILSGSEALELFDLLKEAVNELK